MKRAALGTGHSLSLSMQAGWDLSEDTGEGVHTFNRMLNWFLCKVPYQCKILRWCVIGACSPWVVEEQSRVLQTLWKLFLDARKDIYNSHPAKEVGSLDSARSHAQAPLTGGSHISPVRKSSPYMKGFLSPWRPESYSLPLMQELHDCYGNSWPLPSPASLLSPLRVTSHF